MSFENVRAFYEKLAHDEVFRTQLQEVNSQDECNKVVKEAGYDFTSEEFEEFTAQLLEANPGNGEIRDLDEQELEAVFGGASSLVGKPFIQPIYGLPFWPWKPIDPQPLYGVVLSDF